MIFHKIASFSFHTFAWLFLAAFFFESCASQSESEFDGFSYDPKGATVTVDKEIQQQRKRTIGIAKDGIWISNEFAGARLSDFYKVNNSLYRILIEPENYPINDSPWYAFKIWSDFPQTISLQLVYEHGDHRYVPELSSDGQHWETIDTDNYHHDWENGTATVSLNINSDTLWVSAQELLRKKEFRQWINFLSPLNFVSFDTVGFSHDRRPILKMMISQTPDTLQRGILVITGRQHPPEVTGALASEAFIEELVSDTKLASEFRQHFEIWAYPFANPDGVQRGHWRHNAAGIDLNRDWAAFNQPETQAIRDDLLALRDDSMRKVYYGIDFHSTNQNIFYPINREVSTFPEDFTYGWIEALDKEMADFNFAVEPFDVSSPITKNWIYHTFGADAVTYEVGDGMDRNKLRAVAQKSAQLIMQHLLEAKKRHDNSLQQVMN